MISGLARLVIESLKVIGIFLLLILILGSMFKFGWWWLGFLGIIVGLVLIMMFWNWLNRAAHERWEDELKRLDERK